MYDKIHYKLKKKKKKIKIRTLLVSLQLILCEMLAQAYQEGTQLKGFEKTVDVYLTVL